MTDILTSVLIYIEHGLNPLPVKYKSKLPIVHGWRNLRISKDNVEEYFTSARFNIGIALGEPSGGLVDIDCDWSEARVLAPFFLPPTGAVFGRKGNPDSHWVYKCSPLPKTSQFLVKKTVGGEGKRKEGMVVELRSTGAQTVFPPSVHESGEEISFSTGEFAPSSVDGNELMRCVKKLAIACLVMQEWPGEGGRNDFALKLSGALIRTDLKPDEIGHIIATVADAHGDEATKARVGTVVDSLKKLKANAPVSGWPKLQEITSKEFITTLQGWLRARDEQVQDDDVQVVEAAILNMNKEFAFIPLGGRGVILREVKDFEGQYGFEFWGVDTFKNYFSNQKIVQNGRQINKATLWMNDPARRTLEGIVFKPNVETPQHYNLWRGFAVEPKLGNCSKYLIHIRDNICNGNEEHFQFVLGWMADVVQNPTKRTGTSIAVRGRQGTGKSVFVKMFGSLLGSHYLPVADPRYITGQFNSHLTSCLLLHAEEGFWAGDKAAEGKIKDLITGEDHMIEFKGKEPIRVKNYVHLIITGNPDWIVPAGMEERRFAVFEIGETQMQNQDYFKEIVQEMENGGREALLHFLLNFDLSKVDIRKIPKTEALFEQKLASMGSVDQWIFELLKNGRLVHGEPWDKPVPTQDMFKSYCDYTASHARSYRSIETLVGKTLMRYFPKLKKKVDSLPPSMGTGKSLTVLRYHFPSLEECRKDFEKVVGQKIDWSMGAQQGEEDPEAYVAEDLPY